MVKVNACIIAYNHEHYIKKCLDGALAQKVDFSYEIVISEDCSTDKTREIVQEYQKKYPDKIKLFLNEKNLGLTGNWVQSLKLCNESEYIAICEGDDYWTDPDKLQKQVNFLDKNPDFALSAHNADVIQNIDGIEQIIRQYCGKNHPKIMDLSYLLEYGSGGPTHSLVIRNKIIKNLPEWFSKMKACDWTIQVMATVGGKMRYFPEKMGIYRKHKQGATFSSKMEAIAKGESDFALPAKYTLEMINALNKHFNYKYDKELRKLSAYWYNWYVKEYMNINDIKMAKKYSAKILKETFPLKHWKNSSWMTKKHFLKLLVIFLSPIFIIKFIKKHV
ncbi:glycosyltransferase [Patescibacteria group bacterium]